MSETKRLTLRVDVEADATQGGLALRSLAEEARRAEYAADRMGMAFRAAIPGGGPAGEAAAAFSGGDPWSAASRAAYHDRQQVTSAARAFDDRLRPDEPPPPLTARPRDAAGPAASGAQPPAAGDAISRMPAGLRLGLEQRMERAEHQKRLEEARAADRKSGGFEAEAEALEDRYRETRTARGFLADNTGAVGRFFLGTPTTDESGEYTGTEGGGLGKLAKVAGAVAAVGAVVQTVGNLNKAFLDLDNQFLTTQEKVLGFAKAIPVVGTAIAGFISSVSDTVDRLMDPDRYKRVEDMKFRIPMEMEQFKAEKEFGDRKSGLEREVTQAGFRREAVQNLPTTGSQMTLARAAFGQLGPVGGFFKAATEAMDPRIEAGMERVQAARREAEVARRIAEASAADVEAARPGAREAQKAAEESAAEGKRRLDIAMGKDGTESHREMGFRESRDAARKEFGGSVLGKIGANVVGAAGWLAPTWATGKKDEATPVALQEASLIADDKRERAAMAIADLEEKITRNKEAQLAAVRAAHEVSRAETDMMKTRLQMLGEEYAKARGGASQFGAMDRVGQEELLRAAKRFKEGGREMVTADELGALQGNALTRDMVQNRAFEDTKNNPIYKELLELVGKKNADDIQRERDKLKAEIDLKVQFDEMQFAKQLEESLKTLNLKDMLGEIVKAQFELKMRDPGLGMLKMKAFGAGGG